MSHPRRVFIDFPAGSSSDCSIKQPDGSLKQPDCPSEQSAYGLEVTLSEKDSHHLRAVLRLTEGSALTAIDRASAQEYEAIICAVAERLTVRLLSKKEKRVAASRVKSLIFALAKGKNTELVCEKACELGVRNIILWQSDRSVVRIDGERERSKKLERLNSILESAGKQSGNDLVPQLSLALNLKELLEKLSALRLPEERAFICSLAPDSKLPQQLAPPQGAIHLAVGPEGDFTDKEELALIEHGFERLSLGPLVLRCETAAIVAVSMVHGAWGFLSGDR